MEVNNAAYMTLLDLSENYKKEAGINLIVLIVLTLELANLVL